VTIWPCDAEVTSSFVIFAVLFYESSLRSLVNCEVFYIYTINTCFFLSVVNSNTLIQFLSTMLPPSVWYIPYICFCVFSADDDECNDAATNQCSSNADCVNSEGSYKCECQAGYMLLADQRTCDGKLLSLAVLSSVQIVKRESTAWERENPRWVHLCFLLSRGSLACQCELMNSYVYVCTLCLKQTAPLRQVDINSSK